MLTWLKKLLGGTSNPLPDTPAANPDEPFRTEEFTRARRTVRRRYARHSGPEYLAEQLETGLDATGRPWQRRTWYYPWGPIRRQRTRSGDETQLLCYFASEELRLRKQLLAGQVTDYYRYQPPFPSTYTEQMPQYPGGDTARLVRDIQRAFRYPAEALRNREQGRLKVGFVVSPTGLLTDIHLIDGVSPSLDEAARQAVAAVGQRRWRPGLQNQRAVAVSYTAPLTCRIA